MPTTDGGYVTGPTADGGPTVAPPPAMFDPVAAQEVNVPQTTTASTPQNYTTFTVPADTLIDGATYELAASWAITGTNRNTEIASHVVINTVPHKNVVIEPRVVGSVVPVTTLSEVLGSLNVGADIDIEIEFWKLAGGGSAGVDHSYISLRRVT